MTGRLIPAGTGFEVDRKRRAKPPVNAATGVDPLLSALSRVLRLGDPGWYEGRRWRLEERKSLA
jgi:hypothetical protein